MAKLLAIRKRLWKDLSEQQAIDDQRESLQAKQTALENS
jgi:hypothetical protein